MKFMTDDGTLFDNEADAKAYEKIIPSVESYVQSLEYSGAAASRLKRQIMKWELHKVNGEGSK